jgi:hypothetical protein
LKNTTEPGERPDGVVGIALGGVVKRKVGEAALHVALRLILLAMGFSLMWHGIADVIA